MLCGKQEKLFFSKNNKKSKTLLSLFSLNQISELQTSAPCYIHLMYKSVHIKHRPGVCLNAVNLKAGNYTVCPQTARQIDRMG